MKHLTTPVLCLVLGLIMTFVVLVDVSGATADSWDDDDDRARHHYSTWHHHQGGHYGRGHGHKHKHSRRHQPNYWADGLDHEYDSYQDDEYDNRPLDIRPRSAAVWRNPPVPIEEPRRTSAPTETRSGTGPCREYHTTARIGGREQQIYGQACRQEDGAWKFVPD